MRTCWGPAGVGAAVGHRQAWCLEEGGLCGPDEVREGCWTLSLPTAQHSHPCLWLGGTREHACPCPVQPQGGTLLSEPSWAVLSPDRDWHRDGSGTHLWPMRREGEPLGTSGRGFPRL